MTTMEETEVAVWKYGIISRLLHRNEEDTLNDELIRLAGQPFPRPDGTRVTYSPETLRKWLYRYRHGGLPALGDVPRKNRGTHSSVPKTIADRLVELSQEHPGWTLARMLDQLVNEKLWDMVHPSKATLYRFAGTTNLHRDPHFVQHTPTRPFAYQQFGQLLMADFLHGQKNHDQGIKKIKDLPACNHQRCHPFYDSRRFFTAEDTVYMQGDNHDWKRQHPTATKRVLRLETASLCRHLYSAAVMVAGKRPQPAVIHQTPAAYRTNPMSEFNLGARS